MTREQAETIRRWRCEEHLTWRAINTRAQNEHMVITLDPFDFGHDFAPQSYGEFLCDRAAVILGENPHEKPWN